MSTGRDSERDEQSVMELREVNRMIYTRPDNGSLIDKRTHKSYNFSNLTYTDTSTMQCTIQSAADGIWGPSSYIRLQFTLNYPGAAGTFTIANGTILNLFKRVRLAHRSGEIIEEIDNCNGLYSILSKWSLEKSDSDNLRSMLLPGAVINAETDVATWTSAAAGAVSITHVAIIPMSILLGCFDNRNQYIPPNFLAGARLEIELAGKDTCFSDVVAGGTITDITPTLVLDSSKVYDSVGAQLLDQQADVDRSGMQYVYSTWFNNRVTVPGAQVNIDIQHSASITQKAVAIVRLAASLNAPAGADSFKCQATVNEYQYRLGSSYYPQQRIIMPRLIAAAATVNQGEAYLHTSLAWDAIPGQYNGSRNNGGSNISLNQFASGGYTNYTTTLEKSSVGLTLSGEPTNNSRSLNLSLTKTATDDTIDVYLQYARIANIMGENLVVDR